MDERGGEVEAPLHPARVGADPAVARFLTLAVARRPNVTVKVSALPTYAADNYPYKSLHPYLRRIYDAFGPERMFWGTDLSRLPCSYREAVTMFTEEMPWLKGRDLERVMGSAFVDWLGWKRPGAA